MLETITMEFNNEPIKIVALWEIHKQAPSTILPSGLPSGTIIRIYTTSNNKVLLTLTSERLPYKEFPLATITPSHDESIDINVATAIIRETSVGLSHREESGDNIDDDFLKPDWYFGQKEENYA